MPDETPGRAALEEMRRVIANRHDYAKGWKTRTGRKVVGYFCTYVPEEVLHAAGMLPVRVLGEKEPEDLTGPYVPNGFCDYCRACLAEGLKGTYGYLDGIVNAFCCPQIRQTFDSWERHVGSDFSYVLYHPSCCDAVGAVECFQEEVKPFLTAVEAWTGATIPEESLRASVETYNENRRLLKQLYELRKQAPPLVSGLESVEAVLSSMLMDKQEHTQLLRQLLSSPGPASTRDGVRIMIAGSENHDLEIIRLIESLGANVVVEDNCIGTQYFWDLVEPASDPVSDIARRYVQRTPCPLKDLTGTRRFARIRELAREYNVQGVIFLRQKFCDPYAYEFPPLKKALQQDSIPIINLEITASAPVGQLRTRVEAFLETLMLEVGI